MPKGRLTVVWQAGNLEGYNLQFYYVGMQEEQIQMLSGGGRLFTTVEGGIRLHDLLVSE